MSKEIDEIDKIIKEALTQEEAKFYDELEEQNLFQMVGGIFKGKLGWLILIMNIMTVVFFGLFVYCVVQFFETSITNELIKWGLGSVIFLISISMLKLFVWMQMDKNALLREMKRLEIQVLSLSGKIS